MIGNKKYEERVVAFIDILGFKNLINDTLINEDEKVEDMIDVLNVSSEILNQSPSSKSKMVTQFSDSIVVSFKAIDSNEIYYTLLVLNIL